MTDDVTRGAGAQMITWICQECGEPIGGDDGWLSLPPAGPPQVSWQARHRVCLTDQEKADDRSYHLSVGYLRTWVALVEWTVHLMSKRWFFDTDWFDVVGRKVDAAERHGQVGTLTAHEGKAWVRMMDVVWIARNMPVTGTSDFRDWLQGSRRFLDEYRTHA